MTRTSARQSSHGLGMRGTHHTFLWIPQCTSQTARLLHACSHPMPSCLAEIAWGRPVSEQVHTKRCLAITLERFTWQGNTPVARLAHCAADSVASSNRQCGYPCSQQPNSRQKPARPAMKIKRKTTHTSTCERLQPRVPGTNNQSTPRTPHRHGLVQVSIDTRGVVLGAVRFTPKNFPLKRNKSTRTAT
jgi:hypothetical protein